MFMLVIWLQGIWLPLHGYSFERTPLWAGIYMVPLTVGFLLAGPFAGHLADRYGARPFATGGLVLSGFSFLLLEALPINFPYWAFALLILLNGIGMGLFAAPNQTGVMNSLPPAQRGAGAGMAATSSASAQVLSIGVFFTLMILGLAASLPIALAHGLSGQGLSASTVQRVAHLPPVSSLFASFLGYNPLSILLGPSVLHHLSHAQFTRMTGRSFFPGLISGPFGSGLHKAFDFAAGACFLGAVTSLLRGGKYIHAEEPEVSAEEALAETDHMALVD
jgi:MFS family permease